MSAGSNVNKGARGAGFDKGAKGARGTGTPLVALTGVSKSYGNVRALREVSLEVHAGEITCVLGDNGAGKSTLIKIIAGLHPHDAGTYAVKGTEGVSNAGGTGAARQPSDGKICCYFTFVRLLRY